ncbi:MAG: DNA repair protein RecN [Gammaproteobacteria bacterium]|nr:DNA repair protein RecN [Gammaproteobacteria bacterium]MCW8988586.1 DNA repair protein RecN [Gammaproteobacteria bacterium]MCW9031874.1 DNA repair protein RecN [Gammaproteobacteria bacterium]
MLTHIHIWNFAIVEALDIELESGLSVLTGETGAGKSILLDALGLALGDRADSTIIRHGENRAEISVTFDTHEAENAEAWLKQHEFDSEHECIIRRTVNEKGPSKAFINGKPATVQQLRELAEMLVDLHGQHEHQSLMKADIQQQLVDDYANHAELLKKVKTTFKEWNRLNTEFNKLNSAKNEQDHRLDLLRYQVNELEALNLQVGESDKLDKEYKRLSNASQLLQTTEQTLYALEESDNGSVSEQLSHFSLQLQQLGKTDNKLNDIASLLDSATIQVNEASSELRHYVDNLELDPERLSFLDERISNIHTLARKHQVNPDGLSALLESLQKELDSIENADGHLEKLQQDIANTSSLYQQAANELSKSRMKAAKMLSVKVSDSMQELGMEGGIFEVVLHAYEPGSFHSNGNEQIEFLVSSNPGQPPKSLSKVASGGEISRISLAIQVIAAESTRIPTLIFDEVDVGIGGRVAEIVGIKLKQLASHRQVICVTHLAQVAALGKHHMQVSKKSDSATTISQINYLDKQQRVNELARMMGGIEITQKILSHAEEMLDKVGNA